MIPKTIHYCWFGRNPLPESAQKCIASWKKYCPDYEIIEWNEDNFDISACPLYVHQAYEAKKWAFVTDYVRLKVVYDNGGIYMDTDVELIKNLNPLLKYKAYFGFEDGVHIATGLGFGAEKKHYILKELMADYDNMKFILDDGSLNRTPCPVINTNVMLAHGLKQDDSKQLLDDNILILPTIYLCPLDFETGKIKKSTETISIHWFDSTWMSQSEKEYHEKHRQAVKNEKIDYWKHLPNRVLLKILGNKNYETLKRILKK
ncbi:MAG: glycosyl transferase [Oscillospiraceae bacterium]|nr:glycosyl transferase [Oscillospiraceae bacterium]